VEVAPDSEAIADGIQHALSLSGPLEYDVRTWETVADEHVAFYEDVLEAA
jgi:hypothetical protein